jgi:hypothetical protein
MDFVFIKVVFGRGVINWSIVLGKHLKAAQKKLLSTWLPIHR